MLIESLYRISRLAGRTGNPREALSEVLEEAIRFTGASSGTIALIDPDTNHLEIEAFAGVSIDCSEAPLRLGDGVTGWVALHGKPLLLPDVSRDPRYRKLIDNVRCELAVPIESDGQVVGVINLDSDRPEAFAPADLEAVSQIAAETGNLLRQLWRIQRLETQSHHLQAVLNAGQKVASRVDLAEILHHIARETAAISGCRLCAIHLLSEEKPNRLLRHALAGSAAETDHPDLPLDETLAGVAFHRRKQIEAADVRKTEVFPPLLEAAATAGLVSLLCTPIVFEDRVLGILSAYTSATHRFSNDERKLFQAMSGLSAIAIHNARLYARLFQSEENLRQGEKLSALGLVAAEIAHEIRNPLTVVKLLFQSLNLQFPETDARSKDVRVVEEKLDQLEDIVGRVLAFARPPEAPHSAWNLDEIIDDTLLLTRLKIEQAEIRVTHESAPSLPKIAGNKGQLQQVLLNLILNSLRAMNPGGQLSIRTGPETVSGQRGAFLEIADTGRGIPPALRSKIFQSPLSGHHEGAGLGLGIVKRIVDAHSGQIDVIRTGETGTVMKVWLPAAEENAPA